MSKNVDIVRNVYENLGRGDFDGAIADFSEDCEVEFIGPSSIPFAGKYSGRAGMKEAVGKFAQTCEILDFGPDEFHDAGDFVTVIGHEHCRARNTGREWHTPLVETYAVRDGKIREFRCAFDSAAVASAYQ